MGAHEGQVVDIHLGPLSAASGCTSAANGGETPRAPDGSQCGFPCAALGSLASQLGATKVGEDQYAVFMSFSLLIPN